MVDNCVAKLAALHFGQHPSAVQNAEQGWLRAVLSGGTTTKKFGSTEALETEMYEQFAQNLVVAVRIHPQGRCILSCQ
jgi:hypothetical protein